MASQRPPPALPVEPAALPHLITPHPPKTWKGCDSCQPCTCSCFSSGDCTSRSPHVTCRAQGKRKAFGNPNHCNLDFLPVSEAPRLCLNWTGPALQGKGPRSREERGLSQGTQQVSDRAILFPQGSKLGGNISKFYPPYLLTNTLLPASVSSISPAHMS